MAHFARGARGHLITPLRKNLPETPPRLAVKPDPADDLFDGELEEAVKKFQRDHTLTPTGIVDEALYKKITGDDFPTLLQRSIMLVGLLEAHGFFSKMRGDDDGAGGTAGIIGFTVKSGSLLHVLAGIPEAERKAAFTANDIDPDKEQPKFNELLGMRNLGGQNGEKKRREKSIGLIVAKKKDKQMVKKWEDFIRQVIRPASAQEVQKKVANDLYFKDAEQAAIRSGITSDLAKLLAFSCYVNAGKLIDAPNLLDNSERNRRLVSALIIATMTGGNQPHFEARHVPLSKGRGFPFIDLARWGFTSIDTPPPAGTRVLSLRLSSAPQLQALDKFQTAARTGSVVGETVRPPELTNLWEEFRFAEERIRTLRMMSDLDELPIDILVIGGTAASIGTVSADGASMKLTALTVAPNPIPTLHWRGGTSLKFPFNPIMRHGLVILYVPTGIRLKDSFARRIQAVIKILNDSVAPLVVGWLGPVKFPGPNGPNPGAAFFAAVKRAMATGTLAKLIETSPERAIQAWGRACNETFAGDAAFSPLWRKATRIKKVEQVDSACAAIHPDGTLWRAVLTPNPASDLFMERVTS